MARYKQQFAVASMSGRGKTKFYTVSQGHDNNWECDCMSWTRTIPRQDCKHILKKKLELQVGSQLQAAATNIVTGALLLVQPTGRKFRR